MEHWLKQEIARWGENKEENVLFNDALNTFFIYGYMVKDHSDSERENPLLPLYGLLLPISSKGSFICTYYTLCYTSRGALARTRNGSMGGSKKGSILFNDALNTFYFTVMWRRTW